MAEEVETFQEAMFRVYDAAVDEAKTRVTRYEVFRSKLGEHFTEGDPEKQKFRVVVESLWKDEGEKGSDAIYEGSLANALRRGIEAVRTDGQCHVTQMQLLLRSGEKYTVPKEIWEKELPVFKPK